MRVQEQKYDDLEKLEKLFEESYELSTKLDQQAGNSKLNISEQNRNELMRLNKRFEQINNEALHILSELKDKNKKLKQLNNKLAAANANSANLMASLEEKNDELSKTIKELSRANAYAAELMALLELKDDEISNLNKSLADANAKAANLIAEEEQRINKMHALNEKLEREIDEKRKAEQKAINASKAKSQFLAHMSHEIRTPMNGIIGMVNVLKDTPLNDEQKEYVSIIDFSCENLLSIINDVLDFSKIEAGQLELEQIEFDIRREVEGVVKLLNFKAKQKNLYLKTKLDPKIPELLIGDPVRFKQIIINLINNAIKFTEKGGITVKAKVIKQENQKIRIRFGIADTGIGISEAGKQKLFKSYSQTDASTTRKYGGTGLGLSITQSLVKMMDGVIDVDSTFGNGSEFWFEIDLGIAQKKQVDLNAEHVESDELKPQAKLKILLAEDNAINRKVAMFNFQRLGHEIDIAENGKIALEKVKQQKYDIIFMDINMPEMDGLSATKEIRKLFNEKEMPIVAMTAASSTEEREQVYEAGMNDFISKPFKSDQLFAILNKYTN